MGEFFNRMIRGMSNDDMRKQKRTVLVKENPVYGQTKGFLEQARKDYNTIVNTEKVTPVDEKRQAMLDNLEKARAARKPKNE